MGNIVPVTVANCKLWVRLSSQRDLDGHGWTSEEEVKSDSENKNEWMGRTRGVSE